MYRSIFSRVGRARALLAVFAVSLASVLLGSVLSAQPTFAAGNTAEWKAADTITITAIAPNGTAENRVGIQQNDVFVNTGTNPPTGKSMTLAVSARGCGYTMQLADYAATLPTATVTSSCKQGLTSNVQLTNTFSTLLVPTGGTNATNNTDGCAINDDSSLRWLLCPLFLLTKSLITSVNSAIAGIMYMPTDQIFGPSPTQSYSCTTVNGQSKCTTNPGTASFRAAFNSFRNIGIGVLTLAGIIMVAAQAAGLEVFAAYTVRKTLPRIIVAIIGMILAWPLLDITVTFFNDLGVYAGQLIGSAVHVTTGGTSSPSSNVAVDGLVLSIAAGTTLATLGWGILGLLFTALIVMAIGFVIIAIVKLGAIVLILTFPLAIAFSAFPGTTKIWHISRDWLLGLLLAFPIIQAVLAAGTAVSAIAAAAGAAERSNGGNGLTWDLLAFIVLFVPYFMLVFIPRLIGGAFATIAGMVNDRGKGWFDRARNFRQSQAKQNIERMRTGSRFNLPTRTGGTISRTLNAFTSRVSTKGVFPSTRRSAYEQKMTEAAGAFGKSPGGARVLNDDDALRAMTYGSSADAAIGLARDWGMTDSRQRKRALAAVKANGGWGRERQVWAAQQLAATGTGYDSLEQEAQTIARVSHGRREQIGSLGGNINYTTKQAGRHDLAPGAGNLINLALQEAGKLPSGSTPIDYHDAQWEAWKSANLYQHSNDKEKNIEAAIKHFSTDLISANPTHRERAGIFFEEAKAMLPNANGGVREKLVGALDTHKAAVEALYEPTSATALPSSPPTYDIGIHQVDPVGRVLYDTSTNRPFPAVSAVPESPLGRVKRLSRTYERPNPNNL